MSINDILSIICMVIAIISFGLLAIIMIKVHNESKKNKKSDNNDISNNKIPAEIQRIYSTIDTKAVNEEIDNWIGSYLSDYIAKNVTIQGADYIKKADIDKMLKDVLTAIITNMSDLYRWYISLMINIDNEDRVIDFINNKLSLQIIAFVSKFNQPTDTKQ